MKNGSDYIKRYRLKLLILGLFFLSLMTISGIYATAVQVTEGKLYSGGVDIEVKTYELNNTNNIEELDDESKVMPADVLSVIPIIKNNGEKCYIRIKFFYINENIDATDYITGFSFNWIKRGDYYYYPKALNKGESIKVFDTIKIPENIEKITNSKRLKFEIIAEAVQEKSFVPDYGESDSWQGLVPEQVINSKYDLDINDNSNIVVEFQNETNQDIELLSDFFSNMKNILPGDKYTGCVKIRNTNKKDARYYLALKFGNVGEPGLLLPVKLLIKNQDGQVIYNGYIENGKKVFLGQYAMGEETRLDMEITFPKESENEYEYIDSKLEFIFSSDYNKVNPQTGDSIKVAITIFLFSAIGLVIVMLLEHRVRRNID